MLWTRSVRHSVFGASRASRYSASVPSGGFAPASFAPSLLRDYAPAPHERRGRIREHLPDDVVPRTRARASRGGSLRGDEILERRAQAPREFGVKRRSRSTRSTHSSYLDIACVQLAERSLAASSIFCFSSRLGPGSGTPIAAALASRRSICRRLL